MEYFEKFIASQKSRVLEASESSGITIPSSPHPHLTPLPNWALTEIEKAKNGSSSERRVLNRSSRTPSQSQPPQSTP
jgi:hypothetical protein